MTKKFLTLSIILIIGLALSIADFEPYDNDLNRYRGLTEKPFKSIAIDLTETRQVCCEPACNKLVPRGFKWFCDKHYNHKIEKRSMKRITKGRE